MNELPTSDVRGVYIAGISYLLLWIPGCVYGPSEESLRGYPTLYRPLAVAARSGAEMPRDKEYLGSLLDEPPTSYEARIEHGWLLAQQGHFEAATGELTLAIESLEVNVGGMKHGDLADAYTKRGIIKWTLGDVNGAIEDYTRAIDFQPNRWEPLFHRWQAYRSIGDEERAAADRATGMEMNRSVFKMEYSFDGGVI